MKKNIKKVQKQIIEQIEARVNYHTEKRDIETYHVNIEASESDIEVRPKNGDTFFCIDDLVTIASFFKVHFYITSAGNDLVFRMYGF